jgi:hypothetical protein
MHVNLSLDGRGAAGRELAAEEDPMAKDAPRIVDRWKIDGSFPPFLAEDARIYGFVLPADRKKLAETCYQYLDAPSGERLKYEPPFGFVLLTFARIGKLRPETGPYNGVGWAAETEATFWIFAPRLLGIIPRQLTFFAPYVFVDLQWAISQGREIYGFPKERGWFESPSAADWHADPADGPHADRFTLDAFGVEKFDGSEFKPRRLLEIERTPTEDPLEPATWSGYGEAVTGLHSLAPPDLFGRAAAHVVPNLWPPVGHTVLLKQIPDAEDGRVACHQSIVEAEIQLRRFRRGWKLRGDYRLRVHALASHPIREELGLELESEVHAAYWMDLSFSLGAGKQIYPRPNDGEKDDV